MPLDEITLQTNCAFGFEAPVTNWQPIEQGTNQVLFGGALDETVWNQAYASVLSLAASGSSTIDLSSFTNLAKEATGLTAVLGFVVQVTPTVTTDTNVVVTLKPGVSNGFVWFAGSTDGITIRANEQFCFMGSSAGSGITVDSTHKNITFANSGTHAGQVRVVVVGTSL